MNLFVNETIGSVKAILNESKDPQYSLVLAHGAGAGMDHPFLSKLAELLSEKAHVLRFNFPYMDAGKKVPGSPKVSQETLNAAYNRLQKLYPTLPCFLSGKSYGGRMASHLVAEENLKTAGLIYFGFPLHAPGKEGIKRGDHLSGLEVPQLFLQGVNDKLAKIELIRQLTKSIQKAELLEIKHADHSFKIPKKEGGNMEKTLQRLAQHTQKWCLNTLE